MALESELFAKGETKAVFGQGMLTDYEITRPSQVLSILQIPIDVVTAVGNLPSQLLTIRVQHMSDQESYWTAAEQYAKAQAAYVDAMRNAKAPPSAPPPPQSTQ